MEVKSPLKFLARRIGGVIRSFAARQGWNIVDYSIAGTFDEQTERFYLLVGSDRRLDERLWHSGIMNGIRQEFAEIPGITSRVVLVVRNVDRLDQVYYDMLVGDGEIDVTELL